MKSETISYNCIDFNLFMNSNKESQKPTRIIFIGSRPVSVKILKNIAKHIKDHEKNWIKITVLTNSDDSPPKGVVKWWHRGGLEKEAIKKGFKVIKSLSQVAGEPFDLGISVFSTDIIPESIIKNISGGIINIHFGYLPTVDYSLLEGSPHGEGEPYSKGTYRGSNVLTHAILNKEKWQAVTLHFISKKIDIGPIIDRTWNRITSKTTAWDLQQASEGKALNLFDKYFPLLIDSPSKIILQKPGLLKYPYYNRSLLQKIKLLDSNVSKKNLDLIARALSFPNTEPPYFIENNRRGETMKRYVTYKKGRGVIIMKPQKGIYIQKLADIT